MSQASTIWRGLLLPFVEVCLLRRAPWQIPASGLLLRLAMAAYLVTGLLLALPTLPPAEVLLSTALDFVLLFGLTALGLRLAGRRERIPQTLTALAGAGTVMNLLGLPLSLWLAASGEAPFPSLLLLLLTLWSMAILAHVLRHALSIPFALGLLLAFGYYWLLLGLLALLVPGALQ
ncbi:MAG: hypothetical protein D6786_03490 [Gammaproteobacteria bacterium]|nr:MAG: hypothetical protein D6786_03490 [Gammaproteobacteria bacterium]